MKHIILGIDAGTTSAIAALDLKGSLVSIKSSRGMGIKKMTSEIVQTGKPVLIACDVKIPPALIEKLAKRFSAKMIYPKQDLKVAEKKNLIKDFFDKKGFKYKFRDDHQQDSYASAIYAFNQHQKLFKRIENVLKQKGRKDKIEEVTAKILRGKAQSIEEALQEKRNVNKVHIKRDHKLTKEGAESRLKKDIKILKDEIGKLKKENSRLRDRNEYFYRKLISSGPTNLKRLAEIRKITIESLERKTKAQKKEIEQLRDELNQYKKGMDNKKLDRLIDKYRKKRAKSRL